MLAMGLPTIFERPDNNNLRPFCFNTGTNNHLLDTGGGTGRKLDFITANHKPTHIDRMKSIHIFVRINGI